MLYAVREDTYSRQRNLCSRFRYLDLKPQVARREFILQEALHFVYELRREELNVEDAHLVGERHPTIVDNPVVPFAERIACSMGS